MAMIVLAMEVDEAGGGHGSGWICLCWFFCRRRLLLTAPARSLAGWGDGTGADRGSTSNRERMKEITDDGDRDGQREEDLGEVKPQQRPTRPGSSSRAPRACIQKSVGGC